jgi:5-hydroxyisourate hydrolase-like protein (transthyretin family)
MNNVRSYTNDQILKRMASLPSFKGYPKGRHIVGVRSNEDAANVPDDKFYFFTETVFDTMTTGTTNPGTPVLKGGFLKYNKAGAAVVKADEVYYDVWAYGLHQGKMPALRQVNPIKIYRDGDMDGKSEEIGKMDQGLYGINFHTMDYDKQSKAVKDTINGWSAGCQVVNDVEKFYQVINLFKTQKKVTYTLLNEWDPNGQE